MLITSPSVLFNCRKRSQIKLNSAFIDKQRDVITQRNGHPATPLRKRTHSNCEFCPQCLAIKGLSVLRVLFTVSAGVIPTSFCFFFMKHFQNIDFAYVENLQDSTLANFIIFGLQAIFYAQYLGIFMCVCVCVCVCSKFNIPSSISEFVTAIRTKAQKYTIFTKN